MADPSMKTSTAHVFVPGVQPRGPAFGEPSTKRMSALLVEKNWLLGPFGGRGRPLLWQPASVASASTAIDAAGMCLMLSRMGILSWSVHVAAAKPTLARRFAGLFDRDFGVTLS